MKVGEGALHRRRNSHGQTDVDAALDAQAGLLMQALSLNSPGVKSGHQRTPN